jgi:hypothetical protein
MKPRPSGEGADHIGPETRPMGFSRHNHRHLAVAHALNEMESIGIRGNIDDLIFDALAIKGACGSRALDAGGLAVNGDVHFFLAGWEDAKNRSRIAKCASKEMEQGIGQPRISSRIA